MEFTDNPREQMGLGETVQRLRANHDALLAAARWTLDVMEEIVGEYEEGRTPFSGCRRCQEAIGKLRAAISRAEEVPG
jgi:hypothetical protein